MIKQSESYLDKINNEFEEYYKNKTYPSVSPDLPKIIINTVKSNSVIEENKYILENYYNYLKILDSMDKQQLKKYLNALKSTDAVNNQVLEKQDSFLISLLYQSERKHTIDEILKTNKLTEDKLLKIHGMLMEGTTSTDFDNYHYRKHNRNYVGTIDNNERNIHYLPLYNKYIEATMKGFFDYYNDKECNESELFFKPFLIHLMIACLQVFEDGNTRLGRLLQNTKLYQQTNDLLNKKYDNPVLYLTNTYMPFRSQYRSLIKETAINPSNDNINAWLSFNLGRLDEGVYKNSQMAEKVKLYVK